MTTEQLHEILDNEDKKLTVSELQEVIYKLKNDCSTEFNNATTKRDEGFYIGEQNAFQICLDLLEHLQVVDLPCKVGDTLYSLNDDNENNEYAIEEVKCLGFVIHDTYSVDIVHRPKYAEDSYSLPIGYDLFLTREETEKALAERSE